MAYDTAAVGDGLILKGSSGGDADSQEDESVPDHIRQMSRQSTSDVDDMSLTSSFKRQASSLLGDTDSTLESPTIKHGGPTPLKATHPLSNPTLLSADRLPESAQPASPHPSSSFQALHDPSSPSSLSHDITSQSVTTSFVQLVSAPTSITSSHPNSPYPESPYVTLQNPIQASHHPSSPYHYIDSSHPTSGNPTQATSHHPSSPHPHKSPHPTSAKLETASGLVAQVLVCPTYTVPSVGSSCSYPSESYEIHRHHEPYLPDENVVLTHHKSIGMGFYGVVSEAEHNGKMYAVKKYNKSITPDVQKKLVGLIRCELKHENVMAYCGVGSLQNTCSVLIMERAEQNLSSFIERSTALQPRNKLLILTGIANGLAYLHSESIFHGDLKPPNVLIVPEVTPKISDYGNTIVEPISSVCRDCRTEDAIYRNYLPQEAEEIETHKASFDVFSFGHLSLYVVLQKQPHPLKGYKLPDNSARTEVQRREEYINEMRAVCSGYFICLVEWVERCLDDDEDERPQIANFSTSINL